MPSVANKRTLETAEPFQFSPAEPVDYGKVIVVNAGQEYGPLTVRIVFAVFGKNFMILWIRILHYVDEGHVCLLPY